MNIALGIGVHAMWRRAGAIEILFIAAAVAALLPGLPACAQGGPIEQRYWNFYRAGQLDAALAEARKLRELVLQRLGEVHPNYAMVLNYEANVLEAQGRIRDAEVLYKRALAIDESLQGYEPNVARDLSNLAINVQKQLRYDEAEGLYRRAISLFERHPANSVRFAMDLNNLAVFYSSIGRYADAEGLLKRALPILARQTRGADRALIATAMVNLGFAYVGQGRYDEGEALYKRGYALIERTAGASNWQAANEPMYLLAKLYHSQGRYAEAEALYKRALSIVQRAFGMDWDGASEFMTHLGNVYRAQGRYAEAEALYRDALVRNERFWGPAHNLTAETLNDLAVLYAAEGRIDEALPYSRKATAALVSSTLIKPPGPQQREPMAGLVAQHSDYFRNHVAILAAAVAKSIAPPDRLGQEAFEAAQWANQTAAAAALEKMGMRIAGGNDALASLVRESQDLAAYWRDRDNALIAARSKPKNQLDPAAIDALRRQLTDTEAKLAAIAARLEREFPDYAVLAQPRPLSLQDAQKLLEANEALMFWIVGDKESYCFAIIRDDFQWRALPIGAQGLAAKVAGMRVGPDVDDLEGGAKNGTLRLFNLANAHELYGVLTGTLEKLLRDKTHVMVVASGALTSLPFHLLITEPPAVAQPNVNQLSAYKSASWLIKRQAITVLPSVASLRALRSAKKQTPAERPLVGYGDPTFRARVASATDGESAAARAAV